MICAQQNEETEGIEFYSLEAVDRTDGKLQSLIDKYADIFEEPVSLPPFKAGHDHSIPLLEGELLNDGPIQPSSSPYASPVVLVKKKYDTDLRAGYHQVRLNPGDMQKTAFRTHSGHYDSSAQLHLQHLETVFEVMRKHQLFAKKSKCAFGADKVEYLGHYIQAEGISTYSSKVKTMKDWPVPKTLKQLRGFLGLAGYYGRFVKGFGGIAKPLIADAFVWCEEAEKAFNVLKNTLCEAPVLALPQFDKSFEIETDASGDGIGAVLLQEGHLIAYISRNLKEKQMLLSIYEKELLAVLFAVQKWRHYHLNHHLVIKTDQKSLKYLLEQRLNTPVQQKMLPRLLEFDYEIQYRQGKENVAVDALSRVDGAKVLHMAMSMLECDLILNIQKAYETDAEVMAIIEKLKKDSVFIKNYSWMQDILRRKSKLVIPKNEEVRVEILKWLHDSSCGGHS
uniref:Pol polyprotein n=1 Tax=Boechera divaricarpa TaxID=115915 RepID=B6REK2_9BRAS|nr:pol polyprotein [Boechera divaricarpa]